jgi:hypothetical protein
MRRRALGILLGVAAAIATIVLAWTFWPTRPAPMDAPTAVLIRFVTTEQFDNLPEDKKIAYVQPLMELMRSDPVNFMLAVGQAKLTEAQRERGLDNAMQTAINVRMGKHLDTWLKLDDKAKREYIRKLVRDNPQRPPGPGDRPGTRGGRMSGDQVKRFVENTSPARRAAMAEFMAALRKERDAAGVGR